MKRLQVKTHIIKAMNCAFSQGSIFRVIKIQGLLAAYNVMEHPIKGGNVENTLNYAMEKF